MALFDINFPELIKGLGEFYLLVITSATGSIVALVIKSRYDKFDKKDWIEWIKFVVYTLGVSAIVSVAILLVVWIMAQLGLLIGKITL